MNNTSWIKCLFLVTISTLMLTYCNNKKDSNDAANESNLQKFENKDTERDSLFLVNATSDSYDEIKLALVAITRTANTDIKKIAEEIKDEHSAMITELNSMASNMSVRVANTASEVAKANAAKLNESSPGGFDKDWLKKVENLHKLTVKTYEDASNEAANATIKSWASVTLIKIRGHLDKIKKLKEVIK